MIMQLPMACDRCGALYRAHSRHAIRSVCCPLEPCDGVLDLDYEHGIYVSSKTRHGPMWLTLRDEDRLPIISTWIDYWEPGSVDCVQRLWTNNVSEASQARVLFCYRESSSEVLKGALVEVGAALSAGKSVVYVGPSADGYSFVQHRRVFHEPDLRAGIERVKWILSR